MDIIVNPSIKTMLFSGCDTHVGEPAPYDFGFALIPVVFEPSDAIIDGVDECGNITYRSGLVMHVISRSPIEYNGQYVEIISEAKS